MKIQHALFGVTGGLTALVLSAAVLMPHTAHAAGKQQPKKHLLVVSVTKGFRHGSIAIAERTIAELGEKTGEWDVDYVRTDEEMQTKMTADALKKYDGVVFANTTGDLPLPDPQGFFDYIKAGHGFAGMHSGSDTMHSKGSEVSAYVDMLGGEFQEHHNRTAIEAHIEDPNSPATKALVAAGKNPPASTPSDSDVQQGHSYVQDKTWHVYDEVYLLKNNDPAKLHVLLSMDKWPNDGSPHANEAGTHLVSWVKPYGKGLVFYTILGHTPDDSNNGKGMWTDPLYQAHIQGGLEFILGLKKGSAKIDNTATSRK